MVSHFLGLPLWTFFLCIRGAAPDPAKPLGSRNHSLLAGYPMAPSWLRLLHTLEISAQPRHLWRENKGASGGCMFTRDVGFANHSWACYTYIRNGTSDLDPSAPFARNAIACKTGFPFAMVLVSTVFPDKTTRIYRALRVAVAIRDAIVSALPDGFESCWLHS